MKRDATETKELILNTAITLFSKNGFDGFRMDVLAKEAKVNKATIYYHFKDKKALYEGIIISVAEIILQLLNDNLKDKISNKEKFVLFIDTVLYFIETHREVAKIMMSELSFEWKNISLEVRATFMPIMKTLIVILKKGEENGDFKKINPILLHSVLIGGFNYYLLVKNIFLSSFDDEAMGIDLELSDGKDEMRELIFGYVLKE